MNWLDEIIIAAFRNGIREAARIAAHDAEVAAIPHICTLNRNGDCDWCGAHYTPEQPKRLGVVRSE